MKKTNATLLMHNKRRTTLLMLLLIGLGVLLARSIWLEVFQQGWLKEKADKRQVREVVVPPYRGMILDRHGDPLAVSSPVKGVSCDPKRIMAHRDDLISNYDSTHRETVQGRSAETKFLEFEESLRALAGELRLSKDALLEKLRKSRTKRFIYLARQLEPEISERILSLDIMTVKSDQEYRRFYPASEMFAHVVGFTNIDGRGTEGVERFMDEKLAGQSGKERVVRDGKGRLIEKVEQLEKMLPGQDIQLSLDRRIQYVAYKELKKQVARLKAKAGSVVVLNPHTGEILAMANMPGFNPNNRRELKAWNYRNRAVADAVEPGSTFKPLAVAAALDAKVIQPNSLINTSPGYIKFGSYRVRDHADLGTMSLAKILARSSNVGASKVAMKMSPRQYWMFLNRLGLGQVPGSGFKNEAQGRLTHYKNWAPVDHASLGYGYGVSVSLLQMAKAYTVFATGGVLKPVSILKRDTQPQGQRVLSVRDANAVLGMMESVVHKRGTGVLAKVAGYRIAGKTGTANKLIDKRYRKDKLVTSFIGVGPVTQPRLVVAVMIDEPKLGASGSEAAAPLFSKVMNQALRVIDAAPDKALPLAKANVAARPGASL
ncbi:MAG: Cell division protein FtsI [Peptidoglycan synthetase] (EC [uncultured Thiotrichaceae bacterium]|uniref:Peptidoglycan D,D-transpeptidase FtsI n=1 Tax=uncultured Thiotrichaceae bacterium TaxID=298394 RepID=A0A6S6SZV5_9GAMM|nr:MAG: Cell division protein FtsI [Peptidoglycan synthetase] (EC [uncultured Thiotrichaceae bacterium]